MTITEQEAPPLKEYRAKRDFDKTSEPAGGGPVAGGPLRFVVQRHRARRLHYDLRFEIDGVLASWAVPKGPTLDPSQRRLAVHVEDHPIEYFDFEGVIPTGEYGGGDVIVWDWGTWEPVGTDDPAGAVADGELHADVQGEKLTGRLVLVRTSDRSRRSGKEQWLLLHKKDDAASPGWDAEDHPRSVKSGRTNDEVAAAPDAEWHSDRPADSAEISLRPQPLPSWELPTDEELVALDHLGTAGAWQVQEGERRLRLTNLDKVMFPARDGEQPVTKRELIRYYAMMAPVLLPYLFERPLNVRRYPNGSDQKGFWQKAVPPHAPDWVVRWRNDDADPGETQWYVVADQPATLAWLANLAALELHPWTSRTQDTQRPTYALIDIDPGASSTFDDVLVLARLFRAALEHLSVGGWPKVTGRRGIQIFVPIAAGPSFDDTRAWVETISRAVGRSMPDLVSWEWRVEDRRGKGRLDFTQNAINRTLVAPYSARAAAGAPVSMPIEWDELDDPELRPDRWTIRTAPQRLAERGDLFEPVLTTLQTLPDL